MKIETTHLSKKAKLNQKMEKPGKKR